MSDTSSDKYGGDLHRRMVNWLYGDQTMKLPMLEELNSLFAGQAAPSSIEPWKPRDGEIYLKNVPAALIGLMCEGVRRAVVNGNLDARSMAADAGLLLEKYLKDAVAVPSAIAPKAGPVYLYEGKPHRLCECDAMSNVCQKTGSGTRSLQTCGFSRCLVPANDVLIVATDDTGAKP